MTSTRTPKHKPRLTLVGMAWRNLRARPVRMLLTLLGIAFGVAAVLATNITNRAVSDTIDGLFTRTVGNAELQITPIKDETTVRTTILEVVQRIPGVHLAVPTIRAMTVLPGALMDPDSIKNAAGQIEMGKSVQIEGIDLALDQAMRVYSLTSGRFPKPGQYEVLVSHTFAQQNDLVLGEELKLYGLNHGGNEESIGLRTDADSFSVNSQQIAGINKAFVLQAFTAPVNLEPTGAAKLPYAPDTESFLITGLLADEGVAILNGGNVVFAPIGVVKEAFTQQDGYSEISIMAEPGIGDDPQALAELKAVIEKRIGQAGKVSYPAARGDLVPRMASTYQFALSLFSVVALFMGAFLIYNTFATSVLERTQEIGMLRSIGMQRRQVMGQVLMEAVLFSLMGSLLGVVTGVFLARGLMVLMRGFFQVGLPSLPLTFTDLIIGFSVGLLGTLLATLLPARQAARISPMEALSIRGRSDQKVKPAVWVGGFILLGVGMIVLDLPVSGPSQELLLIRMAACIVFLMGTVLTVPLAVSLFEPAARKLTARLYGPMGAIGARNVQRSVIRTMFTVASIVISLIMVIQVGSLVYIIKADVRKWLDNAVGADMIVRAPYPMRQAFARSLESVPGVAAVSPSRVIEVEVWEGSAQSQFDTLVFVAVDPIQFRLVGSKEFITGQGDPEAAWDQLSQGNALFISSVVAEEYGVKQGGRLDLKTHRGRQEFIVAGITTEFDRNGLVVTGTYTDMVRFWGESSADIFNVKVAPGYDAEYVSQQILDRFEKSEGIQLISTQTFKEGVMDFFNRLSSQFNVLGLVGVIIGTVGLLNTMTMNVLERTRELGMLRALGSLRKQVLRMVLAEALVIGVVSAVYGIVFGYMMSRVLVTAANLISGYDLEFVFNPWPYLLSLLIALGVSQIATLSPARRASRVNIIQSLKRE